MTDAGAACAPAESDLVARRYALVLLDVGFAVVQMRIQGAVSVVVLKHDPQSDTLRPADVNGTAVRGGEDRCVVAAQPVVVAGVTVVVKAGSGGRITVGR